MAQPVNEGMANFLGWQTWYRIAGDLSSDRTPLLVVHGGPGAAHNYLLRYADLADNGRTVIHYDQLGIGRSTHLRDKGADFGTLAFSWTNSTICSGIWASSTAITCWAKVGVAC